MLFFPFDILQSTCCVPFWDSPQVQRCNIQIQIKQHLSLNVSFFYCLCTDWNENKVLFLGPLRCSMCHEPFVCYLNLHMCFFPTCNFSNLLPVQTHPLCDRPSPARVWPRCVSTATEFKSKLPVRGFSWSHHYGNLREWGVGGCRLFVVMDGMEAERKG